MSLAPGTRLGPYEVLAALGAGGMGEVYRARDTKLHRDVALKILPDLVAHQPERLARFQQEARVLASLNHPNIAQIYGLEEGDGRAAGSPTRALVMELVEGEDLAARLVRGAIPLSEALVIALQIALALEAAHELGIVHRDLKPANVKLREDGTVKVLDFGLAKAVVETASQADAARSPTITSPAMTEQGVILGTAAYMAPEQARGRPVDRRADIWAFGVVLYEMLAGRRAFAADDVSEVLAAVLRDTPSFDALPADTPASIRRLLGRCLEKDRRERLGDASAIRLDLKDAIANKDAIASGAAPAVGSQPAARSRTLALALGAAALAFLSAAAGWLLRPVPPPRPMPVIRASGFLPAGEAWSRPGRHVIAISPDGTRVAFSAARKLVVRTIDALEGRPVVGVQDPSEPFFSPDGGWIGFWSLGKLQKVALSGGAPVPLAPATNPFGASWSGDTIVYGQDGDLFRISAAGGTPELAVRRTGNERLAHPSLLPGGRVLLFTRGLTTGSSASVNWNDAEIVAEDLASHERRVLVRGGTDARYVPGGFLVYSRAGSLLAVTMDPETLQVGEAPVSLVDGVAEGQGGTGIVQYAVSASGTLALVPGTTTQLSNLLWLERSGAEQPILSEPSGYAYPRLSRDGTRLAFTDFTGGQGDLFLLDLARGTKTQFTSDPTNDAAPLWTPDGTRVAFGSSRDAGITNLYWQPADGTGAAERLTTSPFLHLPGAWTSDGKTLIYTETRSSTVADVHAIDVTGDRKPRPVLVTRFAERSPSLSPDDRWLAYESDESGSVEVVVRPFPAVDQARHQISVGGGVSPVWSADGRAVYYRQGTRIVRVGIATSPTFAAGKPETVVSVSNVGTEGAFTVTALPFAPAADGKRFVVVKPVPGSVSEYRLTVNWIDELRARLGR
jgi:serine/threonine-protein kinase